jgi:S-formylglutathione hydrolase FrmB
MAHITRFLCFLLLAGSVQAQSSLPALTPDSQHPTGLPPAIEQISKTYGKHDGQPLLFDLFRLNDRKDKTPLIIWLPRKGQAERDPHRAPEVGETRLASPVTRYTAYGFSVVSADYWNSTTRESDLASLLGLLTRTLDPLQWDSRNIAVIQDQGDHYLVRIVRHQGQASAARMMLPAMGRPANIFFEQPENTRRIVHYLLQQLGHGHHDPAVNPLTLADPDVSWADPVTSVPEGMSYHLYPAPAAGAGIYASYLIALPQGYETSNKRYPVLYYLHGGNGSQREIHLLLPSLQKAMAEGKMPQTIVVSVQALPIGWYTNANSTAPGVKSGQVEDVIIRNLIPHIDASFRTIAERNARGLEGWSMGGFGAMRLALRYPQLFAHASSLAGAVIEFDDEPMKPYVTNTFGPLDPAHYATSKAWFDQAHPLTWARSNLEQLRGRTDIRLLVGKDDWLYSKQGKLITARFSQQLTRLGLANSYTVIDGIGHMLPEAIASGQVSYPAEFWARSFSAFR